MQILRIFFIVILSNTIFFSIVKNSISNETFSIAVPPQKCVGGRGPQCDWMDENNNLNVSVGSILHDNCCIVNYPNGFFCNNWGHDQSVCVEEMVKAINNTIESKEWIATFNMDDSDITLVSARKSVPKAEFETIATTRLKAPNFTRLDITDKDFCKCKTFRETNEQLKNKNFGTCGCGINGKLNVILDGTSYYRNNVAHISKNVAYDFSEDITSEGEGDIDGNCYINNQLSIYSMNITHNYKTNETRLWGQWSIPTFMGPECENIYMGNSKGTFKGIQEGCTLYLELTGYWKWYNNSKCYADDGYFRGKSTIENDTYHKNQSTKTKKYKVLENTKKLDFLPGN